MKRRTVLLSVFVPLIAAWGGTQAYTSYRRASQASGRIVDDQFLQLEQQLGSALYAPTWLPPHMGPGLRGALQGKFRVLSDYASSQTHHTFIVAQEPRRPDREEYHKKLILTHLDVTARVHQHQAYFLTGDMGERRLLWGTPDSWVIVSSSNLQDDVLMRIALSVSNGREPPGAGGVAAPPVNQVDLAQMERRKVLAASGNGIERTGSQPSNRAGQTSRNPVQSQPQTGRPTVSGRAAGPGEVTPGRGMSNPGEGGSPRPPAQGAKLR